MESEGHSIKVVFMCGGLSKNPLFVQVHANVLGECRALLLFALF